MKHYLILSILFVFSLTSSSCGADSYLFEEDPKENVSPNETNPTVLNFLGDSIIDYWIDVDDAFPDYLCYNYGWTAKGIDSFLGRIDVSILCDTECVIEIGTNDMRKVINAKNIDNYIEHYIDVLTSLNAKCIYLLSLLPRNRAKDGGFDFNSYYPEINKRIQERVADRMDNVVYIPLYDIFLKDGQINWDYTYDGLHPNAKGYDVMASEIKSFLKKEEKYNQ